MADEIFPPIKQDLGKYFRVLFKNNFHRNQDTNDSQMIEDFNSVNYWKKPVNFNKLN